MPILILGFLVGTIVTKSVKRLFNSYLEPPEREGDGDEKSTPEPPGPAEQDLPDSTGGTTPSAPGAVLHPADRQEETSATVSLGQSTDVSSGPCKSICRFPNAFNNCWMNATLQAALNLNTVKAKLTHQPPEALTKLSATPRFAGLFLKALKNPGSHFRPTEIYLVLLELCCTVPQLRLLKTNDPLDLLDPLLLWLNECGVRTTFEVREERRCEDCTTTTCSTSSLGSVYFLPQPGNCDTTSSLLHRAIHQSQGEGRCTACGRTAETANVANSPDVLTLYLPRLAPDGSVLREPVYPSTFVEILVDKDTTQLYSLSSVICHSGLNAHKGHFWSYLFCDHTTIRADDLHISVTPKGRPDGINENGVVYLYEKVNTPTKVSAQVPPCGLDEWTPEDAREGLEDSIVTPSLLQLIKRARPWSVDEKPPIPLQQHLRAARWRSV